MKDHNIKKEAYITIALVLLVLTVWLISHQVKLREDADVGNGEHVTAAAVKREHMKLESPVLSGSMIIPREYTCDGSGVNLPLSWSHIPSESVTLALTLEDPDVPKAYRPDGMFNHWVVFNIPKETTKIDAASTINGATEGQNGTGKEGYKGPCPPDREHRYIFRLYALDTTLSLPRGATKEELLGAMKGHILAQAELIGRYGADRPSVASSTKP